MSASDPQAPAHRRSPPAYVAVVPVEELPDDLYIPPNALAVSLEAFEGPLDLLLYLVKRRNIDLLEIDVAEITEQYLAYIELMRAGHFELAAEYMVMAAVLTELKSRILLPPESGADEEEEESDPRAQLIRRLQEYERYKQAAENIDRLPRMDRELRQARAEAPEFERRAPAPAVELSDLLAALATALRQVEMFEHHRVHYESISTADKIDQLLSRLQKNRFAPLVSLLVPDEGRLGVVATFLALMELMRNGRVEIVQSEQFGPIHLRLAKSVGSS